MEVVEGLGLGLEGWVGGGIVGEGVDGEIVEEGLKEKGAAIRIRGLWRGGAGGEEYLGRYWEP